MTTISEDAGRGSTRPWRLFRIWLMIGLQSFGGGAATLYLMRREVVERQGWISDEEFTRFWGICQIAPGINLIGQAILIGWRVARAAGVALALAGLLLPSAAMTVAITAVYASIRDVPLVRAALRGIIPATVGIGLLLSLQMIRPPLADSRREGRGSLLFSYVLVLGSAALVGIWRAPVLAALWGAGGLCALFVWRRAARAAR